MEDSLNPVALQTLTDHSSEVASCDISHSNLLATGAGDKTVRVWEWTVGKGFSPCAFSPLPAHKYAVTCVKFSPQGTLLASASVDGTTVIWNARTGGRVHTLVQATRCSVRRVEFTPDSVRIVTAGDDGIYCVWDLLHGSLLKSHNLHDDQDACAQGLAISPDGQLMVTADTGGLLQLWSLCSSHLECLSFHRNVNDGVACCAFSPSRRLHVEEDIRVEYTLGTSGCDGVIRLWCIAVVRANKEVSTDVASCDMVEVAALEGHENDVHDLKFNSSGTLLVSTGLDKSIKVWKVAEGQLLHSLTGHSRYGNCCAFTKDSSIVVSGSNDRTLIVWDLTNNLSLHSSLTPPCTISSHFSPEHDDQELMMAGHVEDHSGRIEEVKAIKCTGVVNSVHFGGNSVTAVAEGKMLKIWNCRVEETEDWTCSRQLDLHRYSVTQVCCSPCATKIVSCSMDGVLIHWDLQTDIPFELRSAESGSGLRCCAFSPTADVIVAAGDDEVILVYDSSSLEFVRNLDGHRDAITGVAFSPDGRLLASSSVAGDLLIHDLNEHSVCITRDNVHDLGALACDFATLDFLPPDETDTQYVLASCGTDSVVRVWRVGTSTLTEHRVLTGHGGNVMSVRFSPTVPYLLASTATDNTARLWNANSGECVLVVENHTGMVTCCAFSQDSSLLITGSMDRTAVIWRLPHHLEASSIPRFHVSKRLQQFSAEDVKNWLLGLGHPLVADQVVSVGVTGRQILTQDEGDILDLLHIEDSEERKAISELLWWAKQEAKGNHEVNAASPPHQFLCPITHDIMKDPVLCADGFTYERAAITEWMLGGRFTSPMTNEALNDASFQPNGAMKKAIYRFLYGEKPE